MADDIAILRDGETTFRATSPKDCGPLQSAPIVLIQGIYDLKPEHARRIIRHRIFTTVAPSSSLQGMVKVAAKRITTSLSPESSELQTPITDRIVHLSADAIWRPHRLDEGLDEALEISQSAETLSDTGWMRIAESLAKTVSREGERYACDRPIAALLVSQESKLLCVAVNTNAKNRTLHAEMNLLDSYIRTHEGALPVGARIYTTLKPCKMCAGMICDSARDLASLRVVYAEDDPGTNARHTALDTCPYPVQSKLEPS